VLSTAKEELRFRGAGWSCLIWGTPPSLDGRFRALKEQQGDWRAPPGNVRAFVDGIRRAVWLPAPG